MGHFVTRCSGYEIRVISKSFAPPSLFTDNNDISLLFFHFPASLGIAVFRLSAVFSAYSYYALRIVKNSLK